jgi:hypothetical protein
VLLGLTNAFLGQPLVLLREAPTLARRAAGTLIVTLAVGLGAGLPTLAVGAAVGGTGETFAALGAVLPLLLLLEACRVVLAALRQPHLALVVDAVRVAALVSALLLVPTTTPAGSVLVWGVAAAVPLVVALVLVLPQLVRPDEPFRTVLRRGYLGRRFVVEFAVGNGSSQVAVLGIGAFGSAQAVGSLRGASTIFGPLNVLFTAATSFGPPYLSRMATVPAQVRAAGRIGIGLGGVALAWAVVVLLLPADVGAELLGETWAYASALVPATGAQYVAMALGTAGILALRVVSPRSTLPIQLVWSAVNVVTLVVGFVGWGVTGAAWGLALGSALKAAALWRRAAVLRRQSASAQAPAPAPGGGPVGEPAGARDGGPDEGPDERPDERPDEGPVNGSGPRPGSSAERT